MLWIAGFGNCDNVPAANDKAQRNRGWRATMHGAELHQRALTQQSAGVFDAAERRSGHHRHIVLRAPGQNVTLKVTDTETVTNLIGCASMAVWNAEQLFHLVNVEVGNAPSANLSRGA
jgi:hypothetical protein